MNPQGAEWCTVPAPCAATWEKVQCVKKERSEAEAACKQAASQPPAQASAPVAATPVSGSGGVSIAEIQKQQEEYDSEIAAHNRKIEEYNRERAAFQKAQADRERMQQKVEYNKALAMYKQTQQQQRMLLQKSFASLTLKSVALNSLAGSAFATAIAGIQRPTFAKPQDVPQPDFAEGTDGTQAQLDALIARGLESPSSNAGRVVAANGRTRVVVHDTLYKPPPPRGFGASGQLAMLVQDQPAPAIIQFEMQPVDVAPGDAFSMKFYVLNRSARPVKFKEMAMEKAGLAGETQIQRVQPMATSAAPGSKELVFEQKGIWDEKPGETWRRGLRVILADDSALAAVVEASHSQAPVP